MNRCALAAKDAELARNRQPFAYCDDVHVFYGEAAYKEVGGKQVLRCGACIEPERRIAAEAELARKDEEIATSRERITELEKAQEGWGEIFEGQKAQLSQLQAQVDQAQQTFDMRFSERFLREAAENEPTLGYTTAPEIPKLFEEWWNCPLELENPMSLSVKRRCLEAWNAALKRAPHQTEDTK